MKKIYLLLAVFSLSSLCFAEKIEFSASSMSGKTGGESGTTSLSGNAFIKTESMEIKADTIELSGEEYRYITAKGNVNGVNQESHMEFTCNIMKFDRITKIARLEGNVSLDDKDNDVNAKAQIIEYNQELDIATLQIQINLTQKDNLCTGAFAVYHKADQLLELSGNAQVKKGEDTFRAQYITLNMETQDITLGGNVRGSVKDTKEKDEPAEAKEEKTEENTDEKSARVKKSENEKGNPADENIDSSKEESEKNDE